MDKCFMKLKHLISVGPWLCPECGCFFPSGYYLVLHLKNVHGLSGLSAFRKMRNMRCVSVSCRVAALPDPAAVKKFLVQGELLDCRVSH